MARRRLSMRKVKQILRFHFMEKTIFHVLNGTI